MCIEYLNEKIHSAIGQKFHLYLECKLRIVCVTKIEHIISLHLKHINEITFVRQYIKFWKLDRN